MSEIGCRSFRCSGSFYTWKCKRDLVGALWCLVLSLFLASCENDLREVEKIAGRGQSVQVDKSYGVEIIYSDSAVVKAKVLAPEIDHYKTVNPYYEMTKGVTIIFFDEQQKESSRIVADYAIQHEQSKIVEMRKNVVATNIKGDVFKSDELIWNPKRNKPIYSNKLVTITQPNGNILYGTGFESDENFRSPEVANASGLFPSGSNLIE